MEPYHLEFLKILVFIVVIAGFVQAADTMMRKVAPGLYYKLGIYLALIITNCIILAVPLINADSGYSFIESLVFGLGSGLGFALALIIMASIREKLELADVPKPFRGMPIAFILTGLIALAFIGFSGLITL
jgi:electron transport complex protein RnfA